MISRGIMIHETENDIVGVGFVKPKPGIFVDRVKQLMIIATTSEISVIGVVNGPQGLNYVNSFISTVTNGVHMLQIVGTSQGRIFMLGNDDNVWELDYRVSRIFVLITKKLFLNSGIRHRKLGLLVNVTRNCKHLAVALVSSLENQVIQLFKSQ